MMIKGKDSPKNKGTINEEVTFALIQKYSATTILCLLQEVYQYDGVKMDWKTLVKRTSTGISNAREYQMVWRHLAYCDDFLEKVEDGAEPLDDDSDLEFELEAVPSFGMEASPEVTACVKTILSSTTPNDAGALFRSSEAPPRTHIPSISKSSVKEEIQPCSSNGGNPSALAFVQKQSQLIGSSADGSDGNMIASSGTGSKKKRKWTDEEDMELTAAVQKYGEANWSDILNGDVKLKPDRTAAQLHVRWNQLKKRQSNSSQDAMLATRNAVSMALKMPAFGSFSGVSSGTAQASTPTLPALPPPSAVQEPQVNSPANRAAAAAPKTPSTSLAKPRPTPRQTPKKTSGPEKPPVAQGSIHAAALAAGGRMATPTAAATLLAQTKNVFHIRPGGSTLPKPSRPQPKGRPSSSAANTSGPRPRAARPAKKLPLVPPPPEIQKAQECSERSVNLLPSADNAAASDLSHDPASKEFTSVNSEAP